MPEEAPTREGGLGPPPTLEDAIKEVMNDTGADRNIVVLALEGVHFGSDRGWIQMLKPSVIDKVRILTAAAGAARAAAADDE